jgi:hypothetical protein
MKETNYLHERIFLTYKEQLLHFTVMSANWYLGRDETRGKTVTYSKAPQHCPFFPKFAQSLKDIHTK